MERKPLCTLLLMAGSMWALAATPVQAEGSEIIYGSWQKTSDCRAARAPSGFDRDWITLPQAAGGTQAQECKWVRDVTECPRLRDKLRHPIQCFTHKDRPRDYSLQPPVSENVVPRPLLNYDREFV